MTTLTYDQLKENWNRQWYARMGALMPADELSQTRDQLAEALEVIDYMAEVIETLNLRLIESETKGGSHSRPRPCDISRPPSASEVPVAQVTASGGERAFMIRG